MAFNVLSNFLIAAGVAASNAPAEYVLYKQYSSPGCNDADSPNYIYGYRLGACFSKRIASMNPDGKVTITNFADDACTESSGVSTCVACPEIMRVAYWFHSKTKSSKSLFMSPRLQFRTIALFVGHKGQVLGNAKRMRCCLQWRFLRHDHGNAVKFCTGACMLRACCV